MSYLDIGLSAIRSNQVALQTIGHNIANAGTAGYHRQQVVLADRLPITVQGLTRGTGVDVSRIQRLAQQAIEASLAQHESFRATSSARGEIWRSMETVLLPGAGSLDAALSQLFGALEQLGGSPQEPALQQQLVASASSLADSFNRAWTGLEKVASQLATRIGDGVAEVNQLSAEIVSLSERIRFELARQQTPNDLLDRRDQLLSELAQLVDVDRRPTDRPGEVLTAAGGTLLLARGAEPLALTGSSRQSLSLMLADTGQPVRPSEGELAGFLSSFTDVKRIQGDLVNWFESLRQRFDELQATGLGSDGPLQRTESSRPIASAAVRLDQLSLPTKLQAGNVFVTVTNSTTQQRTTHAVAIDPTTDTLDDVATRLNAIIGLRAIWDGEAGQFRLFADSGFGFDFAGRIDSQPTTTSVTGSAAASVEGAYAGASNVNWRITAVNSGDVGMSQPLHLEVRDAATGDLLRTVDAGLEYGIGQPIDLGEGVQLRLTSGSLLSGDEWTVSLVSDADETGLLAALGINSFFSGNQPGPIQVQSTLLQRPDRLALSRSGLSGETENLSRWIAWRDAPSNELGGQTSGDWLASMVGRVGLETQAAARETEHVDALTGQWRSERDAVSGVDVNEEMLAMLRHQQAYQSIAKFVASVNETMQSLFELTR
ncbi:MAG: flagellar hook-associated protein FlgK [Planctomycetaceae bacterium]